MTLSYQELRDLPAVEQYYTLCCISNEIGGTLIGNALWKGVPLKTVLDMAGVKPGVRKIVLRCADKYFESITLDKASQESNLIAFEMNGETLPIEHGFPARLLIPNLYGIKNVKWLTEIEAIDHEFQGYWQLRGWSEEAVIQTMSRVAVPNRFSETEVGDTGGRRDCVRRQPGHSQGRDQRRRGQDLDNGDGQESLVAILVGPLEGGLDRAVRRRTPTACPGHGRHRRDSDRRHHRYAARWRDRPPHCRGPRLAGG